MALSLPRKHAHPRGRVWAWHPECHGRRRARYGFRVGERYNAAVSDTPRADRSKVVRDHRRQWRQCLYVYPVISRRSKGLSIGINLNPDKRCNFSCLYCQINRRIPRGLHEVNLSALAEELRLALREGASGALWREPRFAATPAEMRRINDIAFSGDGEPTCLEDFEHACRIVAEIKTELGLEQVKIVVITNASRLHTQTFRRALPILDAHGGEIWAKLDAGSEEMFRRINRPDPSVTLRRIVRNITSVALSRPVVIQSLFPRLNGRRPSRRNIAAYCDRLKEITEAGGRIKLVQVHTIARSPTEASVRALDDAELDAVAEQIRRAAAPTPVETYYGQDVPPQEAAP